MISNKTRDSRRGRTLKMPKNIERLYKEGKCSECSVMVTRMDFGKILGKFTKVKIQYESGTPKNKKGSQQNTSPSNSRLKSNENGMVLIHRNAYNQHPADLLKTSKVNEKSSPRLNNIAKDKKGNEINNILKENNRLKKTPIGKKTNQFKKNDIKSNLKKYGIVFLNPLKKNESKTASITLKSLLPSIDEDILPSDDWCIDYLPKHGEPKEDKVYDRIAAELEDLMNNEKSTDKLEKKSDSAENKDDFPSIMDILNDNTADSNQANNQSTTIVQANLESSDVEAMLLGKTSEASKDIEPTPMEADNLVMNNLMDVVQMGSVEGDTAATQQNSMDIIDNPNSPSILDEALQKGIEEHLPKEPVSQHKHPVVENPASNAKFAESEVQINVSKDTSKPEKNELKNSPFTHVVFKKCVNGLCSKSVTCPKNLKYNIELNGKPVEFLGAPKFISSLDDLKVLLQIVNETELSNLYVLG